MPRDEAREFVMEFVSNSKDYKAQYIDKWQEVISNFVVDPLDWNQATVANPYARGRRHNHWGQGKGIVLKDGETHKAVMTYAANLVLTILGDPRGEYVRAQATGWEDAALRAPTVTRLLRYAFSLPGMFRTMVEAVVDMLLFGTAIVEVGWKYQEREMPVRDLESVGGFELFETNRQRVVAYDDVVLSVVDNQDFYPDPAEYRIENMSGVAKRFKINAARARSLADSGLYIQEAVNRAIKFSAPQDGSSDMQETFREGFDQPYDTEAESQFKEMIGFEYWGEVPWEDDTGSSRRVITVLNNEVIRDEPYPLNDPDLPFRTLIINPVVGRFYGVSPAEVMRWDQEIQDAMAVLLVESVVRQVHPPIAYDLDSEVELDALRRWSPDIPIGVRGGPGGIGAVKYDAGVFNGFALANQKKISMQETSGALDVIQGQTPTKRQSATESTLQFQAATSRIDLAAALLERDAMPCIAKSILRRYQQFLRDTTDLSLRVGELPASSWVGDIMGDFDVQFLGSRLSQSRQQKLQSYDRLIALASTLPGVAAQIPWQKVLEDITGNVLELPDVAADIANPQEVQLNVLLQQLLGAGQGAGNGNAAARASEPSGLIPAQASGGQA